MVGSNRSRQQAGDRFTGGQDRLKSAETLEVNMQKGRNPRIIILNTPVDITPENVSEKLIQLNPELAMKEGSIVPKLCYTTKRGTRNLVIEVNSEIRKKTPTQQR